MHRGFAAEARGGGLGVVVGIATVRNSASLVSPCSERQVPARTARVCGRHLVGDRSGRCRWCFFIRAEPLGSAARGAQRKSMRGRHPCGPTAFRRAVAPENRGWMGGALREVLG